jgi:hypothetical protein
MGGVCSTHGRDKNAYKIFVGIPDGKRPLVRPTSRWEDDIRIDLREIVREVDAFGSGHGPTSVRKLLKNVRL